MRLHRFPFLAGCALAAAALVACLGGTAPAAAQYPGCGTTTWNLTAGQTHDVGSVTVSNDLDNVYVTYALDYPGATFGTLHAWVGNDILNVPANPNGTPVPGQFCSALGGSCFDATGLTTYTFVIPFSETSWVDANAGCGQSLHVVTHAEVNMDSNGDGDPEHETAFGGPTPGSGPRWWFYGSYVICCDLGPPPLPECDTVYAKGGWVWTTDRKSNPESLPSLRLTRNRWGWAIQLTGVGETVYDIWAGAGLNNTGNGYLAGSLTVNWDGSNVVVTYDVFAGADLSEVHVYAGDASPSTIAPGQYGFIDEPVANPYSVVLPLADSNGDGRVWVVAHGVVCTGS